MAIGGHRWPSVSISGNHSTSLRTTCRDMVGGTGDEKSRSQPPTTRFRSSRFCSSFRCRWEGKFPVRNWRYKFRRSAPSSTRGRERCLDIHSASAFGSSMESTLSEYTSVLRIDEGPVSFAFSSQHHAPRYLMREAIRLQSDCDQTATSLHSASRSASSTRPRHVSAAPGEGGNQHAIRSEVPDEGGNQHAIRSEVQGIPTRVRCGALGFGRARHVRIEEQGRGGVLSDLAA